ncbi:SpvB/TcaC N-terminal domain-containing protein [uncultured Thiocystis sp.]|uniref:SpvB/TcaC N-terminal domain-containing protein n=1 Tax=uncultured Thiocystis sp. TaxID=1202134 RepID=UPI0025D480F4|nr:SpvB/TcaC N-terminal domain-containing protein [uncultured Thiocystis sp.]
MESPSLNTGTFTYSVPLNLPPAAAGFALKLELSYDSGAGKSAFGPGWSLGGGPLRIARQVEKGFPKHPSS